MVMNSLAKSVPLTLLFSGGASESVTKLRSLLEAGTEIALSQPCSGNGSVFEVVHQGVTLQMSINPDVQVLAGLKKIFCNLNPASIGCVIEIGLGDHVAGGERVPAIIQALLGAARKLGTSLGAVGAIWHPANIVSGFDYFSEAVADYLGGGAFPVLAMVNFKAGADGTINSTGLSFLSGQELQIVASGMDQSEIMRRVVRVVHDIATNGPIMNAVQLAGIELGEIIELQPLPENCMLKMNAYRDAVK